MVLAATTAVQALASMGTLSLAAVAPEVGAAFALDPSLIGYQISLVYAGAMLSTVYIGPWLGRWGSIRTSQVALTLCALGCAVAAVPWLPGLALGSFIIGLCYGMTNPAAAQLLARIAAPRQRNLIFSIKQTGVPIGGVASGLLAPPLALAFGWQAVLGLLIALSLGLMLLLQPMRRRWDTDRQPDARLTGGIAGGLGLVWRLPTVRWLSSASFCFAGIQLCLMTYTVTLLVRDVGMPLIQAGYVLAVVQVMGVVGRILWGWCADRISDGNRVLMGLGLAMALGAVGVSLIEAGWPQPAIYAAFASLAITAIGWNGVIQAEVTRRTPAAEIGRAMGGSLFFAFSGILCGPAAFALIYGAVGVYTTVFAFLTVLAFAGVGFVLLARRAGAVEG